MYVLNWALPSSLLFCLNFLFFQTSSFPRQPNGNLSNGAPKNFSVNSDENERGVTFRVGKFIGQVTIESKFYTHHLPKLGQQNLDLVHHKKPVQSSKWYQAMDLSEEES